MRVGGQNAASAALPPRKDPVPSVQELVEPRADLDVCGKSRPHWHTIPGPSSP